jgi:hypothetical protein
VSILRDVADFRALGQLTIAKSTTARKAFIPAEDLLLSHLVAIHGCNKWDVIARFMNCRNARQCRERWRTVLTPGLVNGPWSRAEDLLLTQLYQEHGPRWSLIAKQFKGRSDCNVKNRWERHLKAMDGPPLANDIADARDPFDPDFEDSVDNLPLFPDGVINW